MDIHQSSPYATYLKSLNWKIVKVGINQVFIRRLPLIGAMVKIQRIDLPTPWGKIDRLAQEKKARQVVIEPNTNTQYQPTDDKKWLKQAKDHGYKPLKSPFSPTKSILIDLTKPEGELFKLLSEAKRRGVRRARKNNLEIKIETDPKNLIRLKRKALLEKFIIPFWSEREINGFAKSFGNKADFLIAYHEKQPVAGVFHLYCQKTAHYWMAAATKVGKRLYAPTLLTWESIRQAKEKGYTVYDFVGIYDERFPDNNWLGFTKFKEGFGGKIIYYPAPVIKTDGLISIFS